MKIKIKSSLNPVICNNRIVGGTIYEVNGEKWSHPYVAIKGRITLDDVVWVRPAAPKPVQPKTQKVQGSKGNWYIITTHTTGKKSCTCPGFQYRRFCKHTGAK